MSPGSRSGSSDVMSSSASSFSSSPPSDGIRNDGEHDAMYKEEEKLRKQSEQEGKRVRERDRKEWEKKNAGGDQKYLKDLDWFLNRSQVHYVAPFYRHCHGHSDSEGFVISYHCVY